MLPVQTLIVGEPQSLLHWIAAGLEAEGYLACVAGGNLPPAVALERSCPDLLLLVVPQTPFQLENWRRAVHAHQRRRSMSVLALVHRAPSEKERRIIEGFADLGMVGRPWRKSEILERLEEWYASEMPTLRAV
ncbi:MAG: hypothetical protein FJY88_11430 [Candidatus Eisenbacteria bacterium]|nr:hypothetical protein [Candidatus Eisenbacteria bacterium]